MIDYSDDDSSVRLLRVCADRLARNTAWAQFGDHSVEIVGVAREDTVSEIRVKDLTSASVGWLSDLDDSANERMSESRVAKFGLSRRETETRCSAAGILVSIYSHQ